MTSPSLTDEQGRRYEVRPGVAYHGALEAGCRAVIVEPGDLIVRRAEGGAT